MGRLESGHGRTTDGAAVLLATLLVVGCADPAPPTDASPATPTPRSTPAATVQTSTPVPSSPTSFAISKVDRTLPAVTALRSTGERLYWASGPAIWRFSPGDGTERIYESGREDGLVWDIAAADDGYVFSERLAEPDGSWRVAYVSGTGSPIEIDHGLATRGSPPTLAIDARRIAWAGFDESSGTPQSFLRFIERAVPSSPTTVIERDVEDALLWFPRLDGDTLWYGAIDPDFEGTGAGDSFRIETIDLVSPSADPVPFEGLDNVFEPVVSTDHVAWKSIEPGLSALTWGELHVMDRSSKRQMVVADQANHPSLGSRFVAFEEIFRKKVQLYDLATRTLIEVTDRRRRSKGTVGPVAISGNLLGYGVSAKGSVTVFWTILPD